MAGCGGGSGGASPATTPNTSAAVEPTAAATSPTIVAFTAAPTVIAGGQSTTLTWSVTAATSLQISPAVGAVTGTSVTVTPTTTTTYTLVAKNGGQSALATTTVTVGALGTHYATLASADLGAGANLNGAVPFPADNAWNTDISQMPVDPNSANLIASIGLATGLHPDFGAGLYGGAPIGIPYIVVDSSQPVVPITFTAYGSESDPGPYPVPPDAPIEGEPPGGGTFGGDRHVIVIQRDSNRLYEMDNAFPETNGGWDADSGAIFHLDSDNVRPTAQPGWTSADAAGLPIFPGLARYEEVGAGAILHALRFTVAQTRRAYVPPANHVASSQTSANLPPMGMRVRLKSSYVIPANFSAQTQVILQALKTYGMIVADNGSNWYISGAPDARWDNDALVNELKTVTGANFEVVEMTGLVVVP